MSQTIEILVTQEGETTVQTQGFTGTSCQEASKFIEEALGNRTGERLTGEFYQSQPTVHQARHQG